MTNKPVAWMELYNGKPNNIAWTKEELRHSEFVFETVPLYTHPVNTCKHGVDDGACKECYLESSNPYKAITNTKIEPTAVSYTHPAELTDEEITACMGCLPKYNSEIDDEDLYKFARAILRKAQEK